MLLKIVALMIWSFLFSISAPLSALAEIKCVRYTKSHTGFQGQDAFDSWFPPIVFFADENVAKPTTRKRGPEGGYFEDDGQIWKFQRAGVLFPNGQFIAHIPRSCDAQSCYSEVRVRYDCVVVPGTNSSDSSNKPDNAQASNTSGVKKTDSTLERVKKFSTVCEDLGFKTGDEKHADCVLRLMQD